MTYLLRCAGCNREVSLSLIGGTILTEEGYAWTAAHHQWVPVGGDSPFFACGEECRREALEAAARRSAGAV